MTFTVIHEAYPEEFQAVIGEMKARKMSPISIEMVCEFFDDFISTQPQTRWQAYKLAFKVIWKWAKKLPQGRFNMELEAMMAQSRRTLRQTKFVW